MGLRATREERFGFFAPMRVDERLVTPARTSNSEGAIKRRVAARWLRAARMRLAA